MFVCDMRALLFVRSSSIPLVVEQFTLFIYRDRKRIQLWNGVNGTRKFCRCYSREKTKLNHLLFDSRNSNRRRESESEGTLAMIVFSLCHFNVVADVVVFLHRPGSNAY